MRKPAFYICENKDADQLCGNRTTDQRLCFRYVDSTLPLLPKSEMPYSIIVQPGLCTTWSKTRRPVFSRRGSYVACHCLASFSHCFLAAQRKLCQLQLARYSKCKQTISRKHILLKD